MGSISIPLIPGLMYSVNRQDPQVEGRSYRVQEIFFPSRNLVINSLGECFLVGTVIVSPGYEVHRYMLREDVLARFVECAKARAYYDRCQQSVGPWISALFSQR